MKGKIFPIALLLVATSASAQPAPQPCNPVPLNVATYLRSANMAYLRLDESTFPDRFTNPYNSSNVTEHIRDLIREALTRAALDWNSACGQFPIYNDQPVLIPSNMNFTLPTGTENALFINIAYAEGVSPRTKPCRGIYSGELCHEAVSQMSISNHELRMTVFSRFGRQAALRWTLHDYNGVYDRIFQHEAGHVLLLDHDTCTNSPMLEEIPDQWLCRPGDPSCEPRPLPEHCDQMEASFEPADPLERVLTENPDSLCRLRLYCDPYNGGMAPWSKIRTGCIWFQDVAQAIVDTYDMDGQHIGGSVRSYRTFTCYGGGFNLVPQSVRASSPFLMVGFPKPGAIVQGGMLKLVGWTWGRHHPLEELRVFVDREDASFVTFTFPHDSRQICNAGFDPTYCDPNGGFSGWLDIHTLPAGAHKLLVVATDSADDPLPSNIEIQFIVPEAFVNHPPNAHDDEMTITMLEGIGPETSFDVVANDTDIDGQPIELPIDAIVEFPSQGTLFRLDSRRVSYRPFQWASGTDSFRYQVVDIFGASAVAEVQIDLMEAIILP